MILTPMTIDDIRQNREEWAQALESGEYAQAIGALRDGYGYCCLGVLCHLYDSNAWDVNGWAEAGKYTFPPDRVLGAVGLLQTRGKNLDLSLTHPRVLSIKNDGGSTFPEIAAMIRRLPLPEVLP